MNEYIVVQNRQAQDISVSNEHFQDVPVYNAYEIRGSGPGIPYTGPYEVEPDFITQTLETAQKTMLDDVTVHPIQVERTSNPQGGTTVYIGGIIEDA